jgi:hypothetical protein
MRRLAILLVLVASCSRALSGFVCQSDPSCGSGRKCIDNGCAVPDPLCASGFHWDDSAGMRGGTCTPNSDGGSVVGSCVIAGVTYGASTLNPANQCQQCDPLLSTTMWSSVAAGMACSGGRCVGGTCCTGCVTAAGRCVPTPDAANCGWGGAACISCSSGNDCVGDSCNRDGTCGHTMLSNNSCAGPQCAQGAACPGGCAQCSQVGMCSVGQCINPSYVCCSVGTTCSVSGSGHARCGD